MKNTVLALLFAIFFLVVYTSEEISAQTEEAKEKVSITTNKYFYKIGDTIEMSGSVKNASLSSNEIILTIYNDNAEQIWQLTQQLDDNNSFHTTIPISGPAWEQSRFYVITAKIDDSISAISFELIPQQEEKKEQPVIPDNYDDNKKTLSEQTNNVEKEKSLKSSESTDFSLVKQIPEIIYNNMLITALISVIIVVIAVIAFLLYSRRIPKNIASLAHSPLPLITFENPSPSQVHLKSGDTMSYEGWVNIPKDQRPVITSVEFWITIKNAGGDVARNISSAFIKDDDTIITRKLLEKSAAVSSSSLPDLAPGDFYYQDFEIDYTRFTRLEEDNFFVGLLISYDKEKNKRGHSGIIFGIEKESTYIMDEWFR